MTRETAYELQIERDTELLFKKLLVIDMGVFGDGLMILPTSLPLEEYLTGEPLIYIGVLLYRRCVGMGVHIPFCRTTVGFHHTRIATEIVDALLVVGKRTTHAPEAAGGVDGAILTIVEWMHLNSFRLDERHDIIIGPVEDGIERFHALLLPSRAIDTTLRRLLIGFVTLRALTLADALYGAVENFILFQYPATGTLEHIREAILGHVLEERHLWADYYPPTSFTCLMVPGGSMVVFL